MIAAGPTITWDGDVEAATAYVQRPFFKEAWASLTNWLLRRRRK